MSNFFYNLRYLIDPKFNFYNLFFRLLNTNLVKLDQTKLEEL